MEIEDDTIVTTDVETVDLLPKSFPCWSKTITGCHFVECLPPFQYKVVYRDDPMQCILGAM